MSLPDPSPSLASNKRDTLVTCPACGCACDDLIAKSTAGTVTLETHGCPLADTWFSQLSPSESREPLISGSATSYDQALAESTRLLSDSRAPMIFGLGRSSTNSQRAAVALAEQLGATLDVTAGNARAANLVAMQQAGISTCSLGEVRERADLILFWRANPALTHPRHFERYSINAPSPLFPNGRQDRTVVVVDEQRTATAVQADQFLPAAPESDADLFAALRLAIRAPSQAAAQVAGITSHQIASLAEKMRTCRYGVIIFGNALAQQNLAHLTIDGLLRLTAELNDHTRFAAMPLRGLRVENVLAWQTGYPCAVNFARGYPRYQPGEFSAQEVLEREETDCCLIVGSDATEALSNDACQRLQQIPTIVLDSAFRKPEWEPSVWMPTQTVGWDEAGTIYRMDDVPLLARAVQDARYRSIQSILKELADRVSQSPR